MTADIAGRLVPGELQAGVTVALAGCPAFIAVARARRTVTL
jgi:ABC-type Fe3+-siderophore transport system permease subunit